MLRLMIFTFSIIMAYITRVSFPTTRESEIPITMSIMGTNSIRRQSLSNFKDSHFFLLNQIKILLKLLILLFFAVFFHMFFHLFLDRYSEKLERITRMARETFPYNLLPRHIAFYAANIVTLLTINLEIYIDYIKHFPSTGSYSSHNRLFIRMCEGSF